MNRKAHLIAAISALATGLSASAATASFDFEAETATSEPRTGTISSLSMTDNGLTITLTRSSGAGFDIVSNVDDQAGKPAGWGEKSLDPFWDVDGADSWIANFSKPISAFTIQFGDYGGDSDTPATLAAFDGADGTGSSLGSASDTWAGGESFSAFKSLGVSELGINSVVFTSGGSFPNSLFWDNISIRFDGDVGVPDGGATLCLLGLGFATILRLRKFSR